MRVGDVYWIFCPTDETACGYGLYLGPGRRGDRTTGIHTFLWSAAAVDMPPRVATFDEPYWEFNVLEDHQDQRLTKIKELFSGG